MPIQAYVTTDDPKTTGKLKIEGKEILTTLGPGEDALAIQLQELFEAVSNAIRPSLQAESELKIEVTGSVSMKAKGGVKYLFFNIGGEAGSTGSMKIILCTTLKPATESAKSES